MKDQNEIEYAKHAAIENAAAGEGKSLGVTSSADFKPEVQFKGNPDLWRLISKAWNEKEGWMKSTKAMEVNGGVVLQVTTQQGCHVAEALVYVPGAVIRLENGNLKIW